MWKQWINLLLGLAIIVMAFNNGENGHIIRFAIAGMLVAVVSLWSALEKKP